MQSTQRRTGCSATRTETIMPSPYTGPGRRLNGEPVLSEPEPQDSVSNAGSDEGLGRVFVAGNALMSIVGQKFKGGKVTFKSKNKAAKASNAPTTSAAGPGREHRQDSTSSASSASSAASDSTADVAVNGDIKKSIVNIVTEVDEVEFCEEKDD